MSEQPPSEHHRQLQALTETLRERVDSEKRFGMDVLPKPPPASPTGGEVRHDAQTSNPPTGPDKTGTDPAARAEKKAQLLETLRNKVESCEACELCQSRNNLVFGEGDPDAELMFIGEAPGADEDRLGRPFVGRAGKKLTDIIEKGMEISREKVYIANILKCRPPNNRTPVAAERAACMEYLLEQIDIIQPRIIIALGSTALNGLMGSSQSISKARGSFQTFHGTPLMPTYHPAYVLRRYTRDVRKKVWDDMCKVLDKLEELRQS